MTDTASGPGGRAGRPLDGISLADARISAVGECMMELSDTGDGVMRRAYGGDTLNTALYMARLGAQTRYVTALGDDPYSDEMIAGWEAEGIGTDRVFRDAGQVPGLYVIRTDPTGERQFLYWRSQAPARTLFQSGRAEQTAAALAESDIVYLSGISLSLYGADGRERLFAALDAARKRGTRIAFDANYRPKNWESTDDAAAAFARMEALTDVALSGVDDEAQLTGQTVSAEDMAQRLWAQGAREIVVKRGAEGAFVMDADGATTVPATPVDRVVDTTAAGDSFNAGYLAARLTGQAPAAAAATGGRLAAVVIGHRGAVIPREAMADGQFSLSAGGAA
ncbi:sugar kinase [Fodinicurvata sp. EGI_FJ10296]|uniref:sugar kinase n=1 Tax=Fodinicurvata sp. EGI_FJ10296 TaxID=3231908 RepID=UPI003451A551